jgi:hypothetical protein
MRDNMTKINLLGLLENHALFRNISAVDLHTLQREVVKTELEKTRCCSARGIRRMHVSSSCTGW